METYTAAHQVETRSRAAARGMTARRAPRVSTTPRRLVASGGVLVLGLLGLILGVGIILLPRAGLGG